jgi:hypothetical protein
MAFHIVVHRSDWRSRLRAHITDHHSGERFQLAQDEELMLEVLWENMDRVFRQANISFWKANRFWTPARIDFARDHVLAAIIDRRHADPRAWNGLRAWRADDWCNWLRKLVADAN